MIELKTSEIPLYQHDRLTIFQKMILGALGALTPVLLNLYAVDFEKLFMNQEITVPYLIGYMVRILILILYGSLIAFFHHDENNPVKLFQLGMAFPAIITILLSGANNHQRTQQQHPEVSNKNQMLMSPISTANAQTALYSAVFAQQKQPPQTPEPSKVGKFDGVNESPLKQFFQGLLGTIPSNNTFAVLIGKEMVWKDILNEYEFYSRNYLDFRVQIYHSYNDVNKYVLVIGERLSQYDALQMQSKAQRIGLPTIVVDLRKIG